MCNRVAGFVSLRCIWLVAGGSEHWLGGWSQQLAQRSARHVLHCGMRCMLLLDASWQGAHPLLFLHRSPPNVLTRA